MRTALAGMVLVLGVGACVAIVGDFDDKGTGGAATTSSGSTSGSATTSSGSTGGTATTSSGSTGSAATNSSASASSSSGSSSVSSSAGSSSASSSASSSSAGSSSSSASASSSSSSGGPLPPVYCAGLACGTGEICCYDPIGHSGVCGLTGQCGQNEVELSCSSPQGCPGQFCCGHVIMLVPGVSEYTGISCSATCPTNSTTNFPICDPTMPAVCGATETCTASDQLGMPYHICE